MQQIELSQAQLNLADLLSRALNGEEIIFTENDQPVLRLTRITEPKRKLGTAQGQMWVSPGFNDSYEDSTAPPLTALQAQAFANLFLSDHLPDRFMGDTPTFDAVANVWRVPVLLAYAIIGPVGQTGEILVSATKEEIVSHTPFEEMKAAARRLYEENRDAIEAPVP